MLAPCLFRRRTLEGLVWVWPGSVPTAGHRQAVASVRPGPRFGTVTGESGRRPGPGLQAQGRRLSEEGLMENGSKEVPFYSLDSFRPAGPLTRAALPPLD